MFKMQTDNQKLHEKKCCNRKKVHSKINGFEVSKP